MANPINPTPSLNVPLNDEADDLQLQRERQDNTMVPFRQMRGVPDYPPTAPEPAPGNKVAQLGQFLQDDHYTQDKHTFLGQALDEEYAGIPGNPTSNVAGSATGLGNVGRIALGMANDVFEDIKKFMDTGDERAAFRLAATLATIGITRGAALARGEQELGSFGGKIYGEKMSVAGEPAGQFGAGSGLSVGDKAYSTVVPETKRLKEASDLYSSVNNGTKEGDLGLVRQYYHTVRRTEETAQLVKNMIQQSKDLGMPLTEADKSLIKSRDFLEEQSTRLKKEIDKGIGNTPKEQTTQSPLQQAKAGEDKLSKELLDRAKDMQKEGTDAKEIARVLTSYYTEPGIKITPAQVRAALGAAPRTEFSAEMIKTIRGLDLPFMGEKPAPAVVLREFHKKFPDSKLKDDDILLQISKQRKLDEFEKVGEPPKKFNEDTGVPGISTKAPSKSSDQLEMDLRLRAAYDRAKEDIPRKAIYSAQGKRILTPAKETKEEMAKKRAFRQNKARYERDE